MLNRPRFDELKRDAAHGEPLDVYTNDDFLQLGRKLLAFGAGIVPLKCGHRGMFLFTAAAERLAAMGAAAPSDLRALGEPHPVGRGVPGGGSRLGHRFRRQFHRGAVGRLSARLLARADLENRLLYRPQNVMVLDAISGIHTWEETQAMLPAWPKRRPDRRRRLVL